jgi:arabinogalactan endo-1,4-beta-galactosidase
LFNNSNFQFLNYRKTKLKFTNYGVEYIFKLYNLYYFWNYKNERTEIKRLREVGKKKERVRIGSLFISASLKTTFYLHFYFLSKFIKMKKVIFLFAAYLILFAACNPDNNKPPVVTPPVIVDDGFIRGADLSYVNEMIDCGSIYYNANNQAKNPYKIFASAGTELVRVRLWHNATWTNYSNYNDVKNTISLAKAEGMKILLDFHYSDDWADPSNQKIPAAWLSVANNQNILGDSLYNYTYQVLSDLNTLDLLPDMVQVGNETNAAILQVPGQSYNPINWSRNAALFNKGIKAVRDASTNFNQEIEIMLHIAQPENALWWFNSATQNGITDFDWIGISYYPVWSNYTLDDLSTAINTLIATYSKRLMIIETAYPFTLNNKDAANNILGNNALVNNFPATQQGQYDYLMALETSVKNGGGEGIVYWEPAWVSTSCSTQWGQGSHWDNATLFDHNNKVNLAMDFYGR